MTRKTKSSALKPARTRHREQGPGKWSLHEAKARFSELVRLVRSDGPQHVTVHGRDEVVVISGDDFRRLNGDASGETLISVLQASPHKEIDLDIQRMAMPVRPVDL